MGKDLLYFPLEVKSNTLMFCLSIFRVKFYDSYMIKVRSTFYNWNSMSKLFHYHMIMSSQDNINPSDMVGEIRIVCVSHVSEGNYYLAFLLLS